MHIGILQFDSVRESLQPDHGNYPLMIRNLLAEVRSDLTYSVYNYPRGEIANDPGGCDAWITTGSKWSVYDGDAWIARAQDFVLRLHHGRYPLVGICFGHQLIAQALGGRVGKADVGWGVGVHTAEVYQYKEWMQPRVDRFSLLVSHQDQVQSLPPEAQCLAGHDFCPYDMLQVDEHILSFQGHPEFYHAYSRDMLEIRKDELGMETWQAGMQSLDKPIDQRLSASWILGFMDRAISGRG